MTEINNTKYYAGIDIGGTFIKCGIVSENGEIIIKDKIPTKAKRPYSEIIKDMADIVNKLSNESGVKLTSVGVSVPGTVDSQNGVVIYCNNINWKMKPIVKELSALLGIPVFITNDANAAALGEMFTGTGKNYKNIILITLGTGVGGGIIINNNLYEGYMSAGAELGHMVIRKNGIKCSCGRKGCFEQYSSAKALIEQAKSGMLKDNQSKLWEICQNNVENLCGETFFEGLKQNDNTAKKVFKKYIDYLADGITNIVNIFRPEIILIGGGISAFGDILLNPLKRLVNKRAYGGNKYAHVKIEIAQLGNDAGLLGAVKHAIDSNK